MKNICYLFWLCHFRWKVTVVTFECWEWLLHGTIEQWCHMGSRVDLSYIMWPCIMKLNDKNTQVFCKFNYMISADQQLKLIQCGWRNISAVKSPLFHYGAHNFPQQSGALCQHRDKVNVTNVSTKWVKQHSA